MIMNSAKNVQFKEESVARAILVNGLSGTRVESLKRECVIILDGCTLDQARKDLKVMEAGQNLCLPPISRSRFDDFDDDRDAVMFILSKDNVSTISWGMKKIKLSNEETTEFSELSSCFVAAHY